VYDDGSIYSADVCKITDDILLGKFFDGVARVASISLAVGYPTLASLPHRYDTPTPM
jgi:large subunit ribosomal protein LP0